MIPASVSVRRVVDLCGGGIALSSAFLLFSDIRQSLQLLGGVTGWSGHAPWFLVAASAAYALAHLLRAVRLWVIVGPDRLGFSTVFGCHAAVSLLTFATPFKLGDVLRAGEFYRLMDQNIRSLCAVWFDRLLDAFVMLSLLSIFVFWRPMNRHIPLIAGVLIGFILLSLLFGLVMPGAVSAFSRALLQSKSRRSLMLLRLVSRIRTMLEGVPRLDAKTLSLLLIVTLLVWGFELATVLLGLASLPAAGYTLSDHVLDLLNYTLVVRADMHTPQLALYRLVCVSSLVPLLLSGVRGYCSVRRALLAERDSKRAYSCSPVFITAGWETKGRIR